MVIQPFRASKFLKKLLGRPILLKNKVINECAQIHTLSDVCLGPGVIFIYLKHIYPRQPTAYPVASLLNCRLPSVNINRPQGTVYVAWPTSHVTSPKILKQQGNVLD